jgi:hypothetical protein
MLVVRGVSRIDLGVAVPCDERAQGRVDKSRICHPRFDAPGLGQQLRRDCCTQPYAIHAINMPLVCWRGVQVRHVENEAVDEYLRRPDLIRLATWTRLERRPTGHLVEDANRLDTGKLAQIADAQRRGVLRDGDPST